MKKALKLLSKNKVGALGFIIFLFFVLIAIFAEQIAPYDPMEILFHPDGGVKRLLPPSAEHLLGTTYMGRDVFSQMVIGSRVAVLVGCISAVCVAFIGTNIGLIAGYFGGKVDRILMGIVDIMYGLPFLPFALILVSVLGPGVQNVILAIVLITWRNSSRVIRSQVLSIKNRTYIEAVKLSGASDSRILYKHIAPNVMPISLVYVATTMASAIMSESSISFLGLGDPLQVSWGRILFTCYSSQAVFKAPWWIIPPGIAITLLVLSGYMMGRAIEEIVNPRLRER
ncbi:MAG: ABC transporter permease [Maledivibacter sp.]|jgi:peptide/nickel transport system permease protein|nr:ABC transporter permease [Maledivibacter sp.]